MNSNIISSSEQTQHLHFHQKTNKMKNFSLLVFILIFSLNLSYAQQGIGIGTTTPDTSAALDITSTDKGVLIPRVADTSAVNDPATGLLIYDIASSAFMYYNGNQWSIVGDDQDWIKSGNDLINGNSGNVGIGTNTPSATLDVLGNSKFDGGMDISGQLILDRGISTKNLTRKVVIGGARNSGSISYARIDFDNYDEDTPTAYTGARIKSFNVNGLEKGDLQFLTNDGMGLNTQMTITEDGKIGVGTSSPSATLDVSGSALFNSTGNPLNDFRIASDTNQHMLFIDADSNRVGIGTATPSATLDIVGSTQFTGPLNIAGNAILEKDTSSSFLTRSLTLQGARNSGGSAYASIIFENFDDNNSASIYQGAKIHSLNQGGNEVGDLRFFTNNGSGLTNQMTITEDGDVGIGTSNPSALLEVDGTTKLNGTVVVNENRNTTSDFRVEASANSHMFFIDARTNNIGIRTSAPSATLDVVGDAEFNGGVVINESSSSNNDFRVESNTKNHMLFVDASSDRIGVGSISPSATLDVVGSAEFNGNTVFNENGGIANNFRVESNINPNMFFVNAATNRVGIGTNSPTTTLDVVGNALFRGTTSFSNAIDISGNLILDRGSSSSGLVRSITIEGARNNGSSSYARINFNNYDNDTPTSYTGAGIESFNVDGSEKGDLHFMTNDGAGLNTQMIITEDGEIGIGTSTPGNTLHIVGTVQIGSYETLEDLGLATLGVNSSFVPETDNARDLGSSTNRWQDIYAANGTIQTSDARDKTNITDLTYGLNEVLALRPVSYEWINHPEQGNKLGLIAQEVKTILPEVVKDQDYVQDEEGNMNLITLSRIGMYYADIIPVLVKAIQEQQEQITELGANNSNSTSNRIKTLEEENQLLKNEIAEIKALLQK